MNPSGPASNSLGVSRHFIFTPSTKKILFLISSFLGDKNRSKWVSGAQRAILTPFNFHTVNKKHSFFKFNFFVGLKIGWNVSLGPSEQFPKGLTPFYFHTFNKNLFFNLFVGLKIGQNESLGPSEQFRRVSRHFILTPSTKNIFFLISTFLLG